ncbi:hypothetical protein V6N12_024745 [Hibiscus sabdariffa]|uniref:Uncharacterized protein n=3 Tax=Hibiscus sabdariffa TaxID=183260 RepID=A0ABR2BFD5_9ROSI
MNEVFRDIFTEMERSAQPPVTSGTEQVLVEEQPYIVGAGSLVRNMDCLASKITSFIDLLNSAVVKRNELLVEKQSAELRAINAELRYVELTERIIANQVQIAVLKDKLAEVRSTRSSRKL